MQPQPFTLDIFLYLILTLMVMPLSVLLLWGAIKRALKERDKKEDRISELVEQREADKEAAIHEWRDRFSRTQDCIKASLDEIEKTLGDKVTWDHCKEREAEMTRKYERLDNKLDNKLAGGA
jgi:hypothetical protein